MGWIVTGCIIGAVFVVIFIILMLDLYICIENNKKGKFILRFKVLGINFSQKKKTNPNSAVSKAAEKIIGISKFKNLEAIKKTIKEDSFSTAVSQFVKVLTSVLKQFFCLIPNCKLNHLVINAVVASEDAAEAAIEYGAASAIIYSFVGYLKANTQCSEDAIKTNLSCKYNSKESEFFFNLLISVKIFKLVRAVLVIIKENAKKEIYK